MNFINCSGTSIKIYTYLDGVRDIAWMKTPRIGNNAAYGQHQRKHSVQLEVYADRDPNHFEFLCDSLYMREYNLDSRRHDPPNAFLNTTSVVITHHAGHRFVDWHEAQRPYLDGAKEIGADESSSNTDMQTGLAVGAAIVTGLATGLAALGPPGAVPGGLTAGLGLLVLAVIGASEQAPPEPPNEAEIEAIITKVVRRERQIQDAEKAATAFVRAAAGFARDCRTVRHRMMKADGSATGLDLTGHERTDIETSIHEAIFEGGEGTLNFSINHMARHPEMAKWILPAYLQGIGAYLSKLRLHILWAGTSDDKQTFSVTVTVGQVKDYLGEVARHRDALEQALDAYTKHRDDIIESAHLDGTMMADRLGKLICKSMFGTDDLSPVTKALEDLTAIANALADDVLHQRTTHFLSDDIKTSSR